MNILAIDTAGKQLSLALSAGGQTYSHMDDESLSHLKNLIPKIGELLTESGCTLRDLDLLMVAAGPGSFTGLRIGFATAAALSQVCDIPMLAVPCLDAGAHTSGAAFVHIPARRGFVYGQGKELPAAEYAAAKFEKLSGGKSVALTLSAADILSYGQEMLCCGATPQNHQNRIAPIYLQVSAAQRNAATIARCR